MKIRKNSSPYVTEEHSILGDRAKILRTKQSGDVWQFRMWIEGEQKYVRKSLKTRDFESACDVAEDLVLQTISDVKAGKKLFGITLNELVDVYIDWRTEDVENGNITAGRLVTIKSQLKHFTRYKNPALKFAELEPDSYYDYANWRKKSVTGTRGLLPKKWSIF